MRYLLDTNLLSEAARPRPDAGVSAWLRSQAPRNLSLSVLSLGEIRSGIDLLPTGARKSSLETWLTGELPQRFRGRILTVDASVAAEWGRMAAAGRRVGRPLPVVDGLLLATAAVHGLTLVTRNERHCAHRGVPVLNPWSD